MNNVINRLEEQALEEQARSQQRYPCKRCGKPISNRGKRMHDAFCSGSGKTASRVSNTVSLPITRSSRSNNFSLKSATPGTLVRSVISYYFGWIDYCYKKMISNPFFFWFWLSLLMFSVVIPVYLLKMAWCWIESIFAIISIFWQAGGNAVGGTISFTHQLNYIADELRKPDFTGLVPAAINYFFDTTPKEADKEIVKKVVTVFGNAAMDTVNGVADISNTLEAVMQQRDDMRDAIYGWGSWGNWGSIIYSNPLQPPQKGKQASNALPPPTTNTTSTQVNVGTGGVGTGGVAARETEK